MVPSSLNGDIIQCTKGGHTTRVTFKVKVLDIIPIQDLKKKENNMVSICALKLRYVLYHWCMCATQSIKRGEEIKEPLRLCVSPVGGSILFLYKYTPVCKYTLMFE